MTEPDFRKKNFLAENAGKTGFWAFSRDFSISIFWFFAQRCVLIMPKIWPTPIFEKIFFRPKMPEICRKSPFSQILFGLFPYISLFFHSITLMISLVRSFVRSFVRSLTLSRARSFVRSYFHYQVVSISLWLVLFYLEVCAENRAVEICLNDSLNG